MMARIVHAVLPLAVIGAAVVLRVFGDIDSTTAVTLIATSGGLGAVAVAGKSSTPSK